MDSAAFSQLKIPQWDIKVLVGKSRNIGGAASRAALHSLRLGLYSCGGIGGRRPDPQNTNKDFFIRTFKVAVGLEFEGLIQKSTARAQRAVLF